MLFCCVPWQIQAFAGVTHEHWQWGVSRGLHALSCMWGHSFYVSVLVCSSTLWLLPFTLL